MLFVPGSVKVNGMSQPLADPNNGFALPDIPGGETVTIIFSATVENVPPTNPALNTAKITYEYTIVEGGIPSPHETESNEVPLYIEKQTPTQNKPCSPPTKCRTNISGKKIWIDNNNKDNRRPSTIEIILLRNKEFYKSKIIDSENGWNFSFCCLPIRDNLGQKYDYQIDETDVPGYTKNIIGYEITNTLNSNPV